MASSKKKPTAEDVPSLGEGEKEGLARKAARAAEERNKRQKGRLDSIMGQIERQRNAQSTDSSN